MTNSDLEERVRAECDLPEGWGVHPYQDFGFEVSAYDGENPVSRAIEVNGDDELVEVIIEHEEMPGRAEAGRYQRGEEVSKPYTPVPSQAGVLQFSDSGADAAIAVINELADPDVLDEFVSKRDYIENESSLTVKEALVDVTDIDPDMIDGTLDSI